MGSSEVEIMPQPGPKNAEPPEKKLAWWKAGIFGSAAPSLAGAGSEGMNMEVTGEKEKPSDVLCQQAEDRFEETIGLSHGCQQSLALLRGLGKRRSHQDQQAVPADTVDVGSSEVETMSQPGPKTAETPEKKLAWWKARIFGSAAPSLAGAGSEGMNMEVTGEKEKPSDAVCQQAEERFEETSGLSHRCRQSLALLWGLGKRRSHQDQRAVQLEDTKKSDSA
jgi:hypothetical protein